jgi:LysM repeat protein
LKAGRSHSKSRKFRRTGRHTAPSPTAKVARRAGQAAPAVAVVGALAAAPQTAFASTAAPAAAAGPAGLATQRHQVTRAQWDAATHPGRQAARTYTVRTGDTLSGIAQQFYGHASDWQWLYHLNQAKISDPNLIYTGQVFSAPAGPPASVRNGTYQGRHAKAAAATSTVDNQSSACSGSASGMVLANYAAIVSFLTSHGYTGNAAAGIAGNIWQESGGTPESVGDGGGGLIGWTPLPGGYVTANPAADLQTQLAAIVTFNHIWAQYIPGPPGPGA